MANTPMRRIRKSKDRKFPKKYRVLSCIIAKDRYMIIKLLQRKPSLTVEEIIKILKINKDFFYHRKKLAQYGLIEWKKVIFYGRKSMTIYRLTPKCLRIIKELDKIKVGRDGT